MLSLTLREERVRRYRTTGRYFIELRGVAVGYNGLEVLRNINVVFEGPGLIQVLGPNGAGKTTLLRTIIGILRPKYGRVIINGIDVTGNPSKVGKLVGYVPQMTFTQHSIYPVSVYEFILTSLKLRRGKLKLKNARDIIYNILNIVGLTEDYMGRNMWELSGGERQRVFIARALIHNPPIILMDEPLSAVDPAGRVSIAELIGNLSRSRLVIVTSHDPTLLLKYTTKILLLNRSFYVYGNVEEVMSPEILRKIYGSSVLVLSNDNIAHIIDSHTNCPK